tara:strand:+ start:3810 stop:4523 length:714 start_codon:yes stop_codon:yes gene_type:complete
LKKIVILTGSNGSFGRFLSEKLINNENILPILITSKKTKKKNYFQLDLKKKDSIKNFFSFIKKKYGEPDILINNAAVNTKRGFSDFLKNSNDKRILDTYFVNSISSIFFIKFFLNFVSNKKTKEKKVINMLTRHAIWGNKRHVDYYSSKSALYNATRTLARDYKNFIFVNLMLGPIGYKKNNCSPNIIWNEINKFIFTKQQNNYKEIYFENFFIFIKRLIINLINNFKSIRLISSKK